MSQFSRHIALISKNESDHIVLAQAFADHPDRLVLTCFEEEPADLSSFGVVLGHEVIDTHGKYLIIPDYPIRTGALMDQVESLLFSANTQDTIKYKNYVLDRKAMQFIMDDNAIIMTDREMEILSMLMHFGEDGCRREIMLDSIWGYRADLETHTLETHIYRLRQKIEQQPNDPKRLLTSDQGYLLI